MFKRIAIFVMLFCAFCLFQAHNMIPHHHHNEDIVAHHHHDNPFDDDDHDQGRHHHNAPNSPDIPYLNHSIEFGSRLLKTKVVSVSYPKIFPVTDADVPPAVEIVISSGSPQIMIHYEAWCYSHFPARICFSRSLRAPPGTASYPA